MRRPVNLKFDDEDVARWDVYAEAHGLTRTALIETAVERLIGQSESQKPPESHLPAESQPPASGTMKYRSGPEMLALREKHLGWKYGPRESQERVSDKRS